MWCDVRQADSAARHAALQRLEAVGLADFVRHRPDTLSGGQRQRVAIARALVTNPSLVIADEPTANLDSETAQTIIGLMRTLNATDHTTFLFSTHDVRLLDQVNRLIRLEDGRILDERSTPWVPGSKSLSVTS
jgi:putative ABC transport system ATP-binding protein